MAERGRGRGGRGRGRGRGRGHAPGDLPPLPQHVQPPVQREVIARDLQYRAKTYQPHVHHLDLRTQGYAKTLGHEPKLDNQPDLINPHGPGAYLRSVMTARTLGHIHARFTVPINVVDAYGSSRTRGIAQFLNGRPDERGYLAPDSRPIAIYIRGGLLTAADLRRRTQEDATGLFDCPGPIHAMLLCNVYYLGPDALTPTVLEQTLRRMAATGVERPVVALIHRDFRDTYGTDTCGTYKIIAGEQPSVIDHPYEVPQTSPAYGPHPLLEWALAEGTSNGVSWCCVEQRDGLRVTLVELSLIPPGRALAKFDRYVAKRLYVPSEHATWLETFLYGVLAAVPGRWYRWIVVKLIDRGWLSTRVAFVNRTALAVLCHKLRSRQASPYSNGQAYHMALQILEEGVDTARFEKAFPGELSQMAADLVSATFSQLADETQTLEAHSELVGADLQARNQALTRFGADTRTPTWTWTAVLAATVGGAFLFGRYARPAQASTLYTNYLAQAAFLEEAGRYVLLQLPDPWSSALNVFAFPWLDARQDILSARIPFGEGADPWLPLHMWVTRSILHSGFYALQRRLGGLIGLVSTTCVHYMWNSAVFYNIASQTGQYDQTAFPFDWFAPKTPASTGAWLVLGVLVLGAGCYLLWPKRKRTPWQLFRDTYLNNNPEDKFYIQSGTERVSELTLDGVDNITLRVAGPTSAPGPMNPEYKVVYHDIPEPAPDQVKTNPIHHALTHDVPSVVPARTLQNLRCIVEQRLAARTPYNDLAIEASDYEDAVPGSQVQLEAWLGYPSVEHLEPDTYPERVDSALRAWSVTSPNYDIKSIPRFFSRTPNAVCSVYRALAIARDKYHWTPIQRDQVSTFHDDRTTVLEAWVAHLAPHSKPRLVSALTQTNAQPAAYDDFVAPTEVMTKTDEQLYKLDTDGRGVARVSKPRPIANVSPIAQAKTGPEVYYATKRMGHAFGVHDLASAIDLFYEQDRFRNAGMGYLADGSPSSSLTTTDGPPDIRGPGIEVRELARPVQREPDAVLPYGPFSGPKVGVYMIFVPGLGQADMTALYSKFGPLLSPNTCLVLLAGDDAAFHLVIGPYRVDGEWDGKTYDQCQAIGPLSFEYACQAILGVPYPTIDYERRLAAVPYEARLRTKTGALRVATITPLFPSTLHRDTGGSNTTFGNSNVGQVLALSVLNSLVGVLSTLCSHPLERRHAILAEQGGIDNYLHTFAGPALTAVPRELGFMLKYKMSVRDVSPYVLGRQIHDVTFLKATPMRLHNPLWTGGPMFGPVKLSGVLLKMFKTLKDPRTIVKARHGKRPSYQEALRYVIGTIAISASTCYQGPLVEAAIVGWAPYAVNNDRLYLTVSLEKATGYREPLLASELFPPRASLWIQAGCPRLAPFATGLFKASRYHYQGWSPDLEAWEDYGRARYGEVFSTWPSLAALLSKGESCFSEHPLWSSLALADYN